MLSTRHACWLRLHTFVTATTTSHIEKYRCMRTLKCLPYSSCPGCTRTNLVVPPIVRLFAGDVGPRPVGTVLYTSSSLASAGCAACQYDHSIRVDPICTPDPRQPLRVACAPADQWLGNSTNMLRSLLRRRHPRTRRLANCFVLLSLSSSATVAWADEPQCGPNAATPDCRNRTLGSTYPCCSQEYFCNNQDAWCCSGCRPEFGACDISGDNLVLMLGQRCDYARAVCLWLHCPALPSYCCAISPSCSMSVMVHIH